MTDTAEKLTLVGASRNLSGDGGGGGNGNLVAYRLTEVERRVSTLEGKVDDIKIICTRIETRMEEVPSKSYVWRIIVGVLFVSVITLVAHILIRYIGAA